MQLPVTVILEETWDEARMVLHASLCSSLTRGGMGEVGQKQVSSTVFTLQAPQKATPSLHLLR